MLYGGVEVMETSWAMRNDFPRHLKNGPFLRCRGKSWAVEPICPTPVEYVSIGVRARGAGGLHPPPPRLGQNHYFRAKAKFFGQPKMEKKILYILNEKHGIHSV